jgi:hypothetical protein
LSVNTDTKTELSASWAARTDKLILAASGLNVTPLLPKTISEKRWVSCQPNKQKNQFKYQFNYIEGVGLPNRGKI